MARAVPNLSLQSEACIRSAVIGPTGALPNLAPGLT
jgi:hypothetical protein